MITDLFPKISPSLDLSFARAQKLDSRITFSRPSAATYFDRNGILRTAASGVPRFDFDPITGACKGLLIEEQRTNLLTYSEQLDNAAWTKDNATVIPNAAVAPDGSLTADKLVENTATASHVTLQSASGASTNVHSVSVYAKAGERSRIVLQIDGNAAAGGYAVFDLSLGIYEGLAGSGSPTASIVSVGNGWYRCSVTAIPAASGTVVRSVIYIVQSNGVTVYTGDGTSGLYVWGAQLEAGNFPTSYIKTEAAQATRAADDATMTGANFSSWYRQDEGVLFAESAPLAAPLPPLGRPVFHVRDMPTGASVIEIKYRPMGKTGASVVTNNVTQVDTVSSADYSTSAAKLAMVYKANDVASTFNGEAVQTDTSVTVPVTLNTVYLGRDANQYFNGHISRLAYYPKRLTNTELQALTA